jgi:hypothetical protein
MARTFSTPGVYRREIDVSDILVPQGISNGGIVIRTYKGPINRPVPISNDKEFIETFGAPYFLSASSTGPVGQVPLYGYGSYAALEFLKESNTLFVARAYDADDKFAAVSISATTAVNTVGTMAHAAIAASTTPTSIDRPDRIYSIDTSVTSFATNEGLVIGSNYPGYDGNSIAVTVEPFSSGCDWLYSYDPYPSSSTNLTSAFTASSWAAAMPIASKVFKLNVFVKDTKYDSWDSYYTNETDKINGALRISPVETYYGSLTSLQDENKNNLFIENIVNGNSKYIYIKADSTKTFGYDTNGTSLPTSADENGIFVRSTKLARLAGGDVHKVDGTGSTDVDIWKIFENREDVNVNILICPSYDTTTKQEVVRIAGKRMDCIAAVQAGDLSDIGYTDVITAEQYGYSAPSYVAIYAGYSKVYDQYNDKFIYLPNVIYGATLMARVDNIADPWSAPAGIDRGTLSVIDQRKVYTFDEIGKLYDKNINTVRLIRGTGFVMWGQKTAQLKKSALDRINVRRNLLFIENNVETSLLPFCFENNNVKTRLRIFSIVDGFLSTVQAGGGLTGYKVVCDETNNTSEVIDSNQLNVDIYVQPTRTAEFIQLTTVITRSGINLSEIRI